MIIPDIACFFNSLKDCNISEKEYQRAVNIWKIFKIKNLGEYHDLYLKLDVLLLGDVFEKFVDVCLNDYGLDPCHYYSSPGLSWDAMLKMTGIELEKVDNIDIHLFLQKGVDVCLNDYGLDPCHYYSSPGLSWDAMLKMTGIKLKKWIILIFIYFYKKE